MNKYQYLSNKKSIFNPVITGFSHIFHITRSTMVYAANSFSSLYFNSLPSIESASTSAGNNLNNSLKLIAPVFFRHAMHDSWGIALLHKHWDLKESEIPVQEEHTSEGSKQYITLPRAVDCNINAWPSLLSLTPSARGKIHPLEFTATRDAQTKFSDLMDKLEFIEELQSLLAANDLLNTFGLVQGKSTSFGHQLVENSIQERMSILSEVPIDNSSAQTLVQTAWFFSINLKGMQCSMHCGKACAAN